MKKFALTLSVLALTAFTVVPRSIHAESGTTIVDSEWVVKAGEGFFEKLTTKGGSFQASVSPVKNADKGFRVRVVNADDVMSCMVKGGTCRELLSWRQPRTRAFTQTENIPSGDWAFLVENSENLFKTMTVHVTLTSH